MPIGIITNPQYRTLKVGDITNGHYFAIDGNGNVILSGNARSYTDYSVPLTRDRQGVASKPDYDFTNLGLLFPQNDESEEIFLNFQMLHQKSFGTTLDMHVHYIQEAAEQPIFEMQYKFYNNAADVPGSWITVDTSLIKGKYTWSTNPMMQIGEFPPIAAPAGEIVSANLDVKIYRQTGDGLAGDVLTKYVDFHFLIDGFGSDEEYTK